MSHKKEIKDNDNVYFKTILNFGGMSDDDAKQKFEDLKVCDKLKDDFCKDSGYKMIRIGYKEFPNILSILHKELIGVIDTVG